MKKNRDSVTHHDIPQSEKYKMFKDIISQSDTKTLIDIIPDNVKDTIWRSIQMDGACEEIKKQVALYNLSNKKGFFFMSPQEARRVVSYVEDIRKGNYTYNPTQAEMAQDEMVKKWVSQYLTNASSIKEVEAPEMTDGFSIGWLSKMFLEVESKECMVSALVMSAKNYALVRNWGKSCFDESTRVEALKRGVFGHIWTADIYVHNSIQDSHIMLISDISQNLPYGVNIMAKIPPLVEKPKQKPLDEKVLEELGNIKQQLAIHPITASVDRTAEDRLWELIRFASSNGPLIRVKVETGSWLGHQHFPKDARVNGYITGDSTAAVIIYKEGELIPIKMMKLEGKTRASQSSGIDLMEAFVRQLVKTLGSKVFYFCIDEGNKEEMLVGVCAVDSY